MVQRNTPIWGQPRFMSVRRGLGMRDDMGFAQLHEYDADQPSIRLDVTLRLAHETVNLFAKLDTGATNCVFARQYGEQIGLTIESGERLQLSTPTGTFLAYCHPVTIEVRGYRFDSVACFAADESFQRNVLGRHGFLEQVRLANELPNLNRNHRFQANGAPVSYFSPSSNKLAAFVCLNLSV